MYVYVERPTNQYNAYTCTFIEFFAKFNTYTHSVRTHKKINKPNRKIGS